MPGRDDWHVGGKGTDREAVEGEERSRDLAEWGGNNTMLGDEPTYGAAAGFRIEGPPTVARETGELETVGLRILG